MVIRDYRINQRIRARGEIRLIDEKGEQAGIVSREEALSRAENLGLDLVEVAPNATPPVCRIIDYGKFKYEQEKVAKDAKKKQAVIHVKEVRFGPNIEEHDYQVKLRNICRFLSHGDKVKVSVFFKGREMAFMEKGRQLLDRVTKDAEEFGKVDKLPGREGRAITMIMVAYGKAKERDRG